MIVSLATQILMIKSKEFLIKMTKSVSHVPHRVDNVLILLIPAKHVLI
jgi:hypothetical protein